MDFYVALATYTEAAVKHIVEITDHLVPVSVQALAAVRPVGAGEVSSIFCGNELEVGILCFLCTFLP